MMTGRIPGSCQSARPAGRSLATTRHIGTPAPLDAFIGMQREPFDALEGALDGGSMNAEPLA
jgi:hypothetical protein